MGSENPTQIHPLETFRPSIDYDKFESEVICPYLWTAWIHRADHALLQLHLTLAPSQASFVDLLSTLEEIDYNQSLHFLESSVTLVLPRFSSVFFFWFFIGFFITENAVIDITIQEMVINIAPLHTFQIFKKLSKYMLPILKYSKNNMWFFLNGSKKCMTAYLAYVIS